MFSLMDYNHEKRSTNKLIVLSGVAALLDTAIGGIICLALDLSRPLDLLLGISLVLGFPLFLLDLRLKRRFAFSLLALFIFRSAVRTFGGPTPVLGNPFDWPLGILLFSSFALLQLAKLQNTPA